MEHKIKIAMEWYKEDYSPVEKHHEEALQESGVDRIVDQMKDGFTSGELHDSIFMLDTDLNWDGEEGIVYTGTWSVNWERV